MPSGYRQSILALASGIAGVYWVWNGNAGASVFRIKICGVRLENDIRAVEQSGGDAIGFNFFPPSVRFVDPASEDTRTLSNLAHTLGLLRVGVFVNHRPSEIELIAKDIGLDAIQLHGDETPDSAAELIEKGYRVIRAIKLPKGPIDQALIHQRSDEWIQLGCHVLLDVDAGAEHGGSGKTLHWPSVSAWAKHHPEVNWTLAGGLKPENVREAIRESGAISVDTASGVECPRGVKNEGRVRAFVAAASALPN